MRGDVVVVVNKDEGRGVIGTGDEIKVSVIGGGPISIMTKIYSRSLINLYRSTPELMRNTIRMNVQ